MLAGALALLIVGFYAWVASAGTLTRWPMYGPYYDELAHGFLLGQTHLMREPDPRLLALPDPYDPVRNQPYRFHDAVLFDGKYYLYWGPLPALLLAGYKLVLAADPAAVVGDQYLGFAFAAATLSFVAATLVRLRARAYPDVPWWAVGPPIVSAGLAGPVAFTLARASVYEAAIHGGQAFLAGGLYCLLVAFTGPTARPRPRWLLAAGACCGAAVACRSSLLPAVAAVGLAAAWRLWRIQAPPADADNGDNGSGGGGRDGLTRRVLPPLAAFAAPVALAVVTLLAYNVARFGSPTEFGVRYQLAVFHSGQATGKLFAARYVPANLWRSLFDGPVLDRRFPHVWPGNSGAIVRAFDLPAEFLVEPLPGLAWSAPFLAFALVPPAARLLAAARRRRRGRWRATDTTATAAATATATATDVSPPPHANVGGWFALALAAVAVLGSLPSLAILASIARYQLELTTPAGVLAGVGFWQLLRATRPSTWPRRAVVTAAVAAATVTAVVAPLLGYTGFTGAHFQTHNPELHQKIVGTAQR